MHKNIKLILTVHELSIKSLNNEIYYNCNYLIVGLPEYTESIFQVQSFLLHCQVYK